jgi:hypothetical protein
MWRAFRGGNSTHVTPCLRQAYTGPPMDLDNMRSLGVTRIDVYCSCGHQATIDVSNLPGDLAVLKSDSGCVARNAANGRMKPAGLDELPVTRQVVSAAVFLEGAPMPQNRRELFLDHGRVFVETPRLMTDEELAVVFEAFVNQVRSPDAETPCPAAP